MKTEKSFTFRTYQKLFEAVKKSAFYNKRSVNKEIEFVLEQYYKIENKI